jgi:outer membrane protein assembly factor BamE (lipoprotein component of BamABCDE complex)
VPALSGRGIPRKLMKTSRAITVGFTFASIALLSGCASQGGFEGTMNKVGSTIGSAASKVAGVAKDVGGHLVPSDYISGFPVSEEALTSLKPGMSEAEVETIIGMAPDVSTTNTGDIWKYPYVKMTAWSGENVNETTIARFDGKGKLVRAYKVQGGGAAASGHPLLQAAEAQGQL